MHVSSSHIPIRSRMKRQVNMKKEQNLCFLGATVCLAKTDGVDQLRFLSCSMESSRLRNIVRMSKMAVSTSLATLILQNSRLNLYVNKADLRCTADCKVQ